MSTPVSSLELDHLVYILPTDKFESPPSFFSDNFTIIEGGTHSDGCSRNKLIIFRDGTYIELFDWIDRANSMFVDWAERGYGWVDFAMTSGDESAKSVHQRISEGLKQQQTDIVYAEPKGGGRKRPDGVELKWETFRAKTSWAVPFFCHDVTERTLRVPCNDEQATRHPCGATGVESISIHVSSEDKEAYSGLYQAVLGVNAEENNPVSTYKIKSPERVGEHNVDIILSQLHGNQKIGISNVSVRTHNGAQATSLLLKDDIYQSS